MSAVPVDRVYLYSYGHRRHIAAKSNSRWNYQLALCGVGFCTDAYMHQSLMQEHGAWKADRKMVQLRQLPVCRSCEQAEARLTPSVEEAPR